MLPVTLQPKKLHIIMMIKKDIFYIVQIKMNIVTLQQTKSD